MRKSLDTRLISNLTKRKPIFTPWYNNHILTDNDIDRVEETGIYTDGKKGYKIYVKNLYTGGNDIGPYLEKHLNIDEIKSISIAASALPNFYFSISAANEIGDDIFEDYDISTTFSYKPSPEVLGETIFADGSLNNSHWFLSLPEYFMNFNGVWIISDNIRGE